MWGLIDSPLFGVHYMLLLMGLSGVRYRIKSHTILHVIEIITSGLYAIWWPPALIGLWLPIIGFIENKWIKNENKYLEEGYNERARRLLLESQIDQSSKDSVSAARLAEMNERARIAQNIHDHVGHEMHGALIALQTAKKLYNIGDARTEELMAQSLARLESASATLRETVHNLRPAYTIGPDTLMQICKGFWFCDIKFAKSGDLTNVIHWEMLAANLKELLTNIAKHTDASEALVNLDGNVRYVRLIVKDNGTVKKKLTSGLGLSGMKDRTRMAGGTLTISDTIGFQVVIVLPKGM